jgi:aryl-alcohol dehydrogenase-like predicted oxidoreductase
VNWIDTAAEYGLGHAEEVVAAALHGVADGDRPYVFTKCGMVWNDADRKAEAAQIGHPDSIRRECEASLVQCQNPSFGPHLGFHMMVRRPFDTRGSGPRR